jgi:hypothetical protein
VNAADVHSGLLAVSDADQSAWAEIRQSLAAVMEAPMFAIWLAPLQVVAVDRDGTPVVICTPELRGWLVDRFGRAISTAGESAGRPLLHATRQGVAVSRVQAATLASAPAPTTWAHHEACAWTAAWLTVRGR